MNMRGVRWTVRRLRWVVIAGVVAIASAAAMWQLNVLEVRARAPFATVASAFDAAPAYPGYRWLRNGRVVGEFELTTIAGPAHCGWESATMLFIGWPPGTSAPTSEQSRFYIRDPQGVFGRVYRDRLARAVSLPADATSLGYQLGPIELYLSRNDQDEAIYVVAPSGAERWPRVPPGTPLCA